MGGSLLCFREIAQGEVAVSIHRDDKRIAFHHFSRTGIRHDDGHEHNA